MANLKSRGDYNPNTPYLLQNLAIYLSFGSAVVNGILIVKKSKKVVKSNY